MKNFGRLRSPSGQTLVTVLIFVIIAITLTAGAIALTITNSQTATSFDLGNKAYYTAEAGVENAMLRLLRDPSYTGETLVLGDSNTAEIVVDGAGPFTIISTGRSGNFVRKVQATADYTGNVFAVTAWKEIE